MSGTVLLHSQRSPDRQDLLDRVPGLVAEIAPGAARRDLDRDLPHAAFRAIRASGIGALRIPRALGGPGGSIEDYVEVIATLGAADSNVAHALRSHFNFTETVVQRAHDRVDPLALDRILSGHIFGGAHTENLTRNPLDIGARLTLTPRGYRLNGRKWYATGTAFADYATFSATDDAGAPVSVLLPVDRPGITIHDDWDGMGQRLTASGGVTLDDVEVLPEEIATRDLTNQIARHCSTLRQIHLAACAAGAVRRLLQDGRDYVRSKARAAGHSQADAAGDDPFIQRAFGEIAALSFAVDTLIREASRALDRTSDAFVTRDIATIETALLDAALTGSKAQLVAGDLSLQAAGKLYELGGGSITSRELNLDRHWRNIRTVLNHNPLALKARVVGDYYLNGTTTHLLEGRVF